MTDIIIIINLCIVAYFTLLVMGYTLLLFASFADIRRSFNEAEYGNIIELIHPEQNLIPISVIIPTYNEQECILDAIFSILNSGYKDIHIIIVSDGSTDNTVKVLSEAFSLYEVPSTVQQKIPTAAVRHYYQSAKFPNIVVIDKEHSNTGDTLNVGINACRSHLFMTVDADTVIEKNTISQIFFTFLSNFHCILLGGAVYVLNGNKVVNGEFVASPKIPNNFVAAIQVCEYMRSFLFSRAGWNVFGGALSFAGAFTFFETELVVESGGFDLNNYAQDAEIVLRLHSWMRMHPYPYCIRFTPSAFAWTEVPFTFKMFWHQRSNWQRGLMRSFFLYKHMFLNPRYGIVGCFSYPFYILFEIMSPVVEFTAYITLILGWALNIVSIEVIVLFIALAWGYIAFLTMSNLLISLITFNKYRKFSDILFILALSIVEILGFRQFHVFCKFTAIIQYTANRIRGKRL